MRWLPLLMMGLLALAGCDDDTPVGDLRGEDAWQGAPAGDAGTLDGGGGGTPAGLCDPGETRCVDGMLRTCIDDATGWLVERCDAAARCVDGACVELTCAPGARRCVDGAPEACDLEGTGWAPTDPCDAEQSCIDGVCLAQLCEPGEVACGEGVSLTCGPDGLGWARAPCGAGEICIDGACRPPMGGIQCPPGDVLCGARGLYACNDTGDGWVETPCADGQACFEGQCVECVRDQNCGDGVCEDGACVAAPLAIRTSELPVGRVGEAYEAPLEAAHGARPYQWRVDGLPAGLALDGDAIRGTPEAAGRFPLTITASDDAGAEASADLTLRITGDGLEILTERLPDAEDGADYRASFEAGGGSAPYGWFLVEGALPEGLALAADGTLAGAPSEVGQFDFTLRVVDADTPPGFAERAFTLTVSIAPLRIVADQLLELFVTRIVTLPTITVVPNVPIPYRAELQAAGGLRPYHWAEVELPEGLRGFIPQSGLPEGLELLDDGTLQGAVVDPAQIVELQIPFTEIVLTGFFFFAEVSDEQDPPATQQAVFVLPTLPIGI